jgi:hypothetical protein
MKHLIILLFFTLINVICVAQNNNIWTQGNAGRNSPGRQVLSPDKCLVYSLRELYLKTILFNLLTDPEQAKTIELPTPEGKLRVY